MKTDDYKVILDSLPTTGIYVIREDDHRILYFNSCIKETMPAADLGMVCHEVWSGSCHNCPLLHIGDKKESKSISYDNPFGEAVDITAVRVLWENEIPAFVITITPHIEVSAHTFCRILRANLTDDRFEIVKGVQEEEAKMEKIPGTLSGYLEWMAESGMVFEEDKNRFRKFSGLAYMRRELRAGKKLINCSYREKRGGGYRWNTLEVVPDFQYSDDRQSVMIYTKDVHDTYREGLERQEISIRNQERLAMIIRSRYDVMNAVYLDTGMCDRVFLNGAGRSGQVATGDYEHYMKQAAEHFVHEEDREAFAATLFLENLRKKAEQVYDFKEEVCRYRLKKEPSTWLEEHVYYICQGDQKMVLILGRNISEEKRDEEKNFAEKKVRGSIIHALSGLFVAAYYVNLEEDVYQAVSRQGARQISGDKRNFTEGIHIYAERFVHPENREEYLRTFSRENIKRSLTCEHPHMAMEYRRISGNSEFVKQGWTRATAILADEHAKTVLYVVQDVTETREKEEEGRRALKEACDAAIHANAAKSDFMSRMSHDIRTPMNAIIGMTTIAGKHVDDHERVKDCLGKIMVSSRHLLSLVNEVLDMSRIESGKLSLSEEKFNLSDLIQNLVTLVRPSAKAKGQKLEFRIVKVEHEDVYGDVVRLQQVFMNILGNSVKYTPPGGRLELEISEKPSEIYGYGNYEFIFSDNGIGMDKEFLQRIFEPFSRAEDSRISKIEGTGLGMAIVQNLVNLMNGSIHVESEKDKGSRFTVTVFLKQQDIIPPDMASFRECKVLVADKDAHAGSQACGLINGMGMAAEWVQEGKKALEYIESQPEKEPYFAVILNARLADMGGVEAAARIRSAPGTETLKIILSAYDWSSMEEEARRAGVDGFISKPLFKSRLVCLFRKLAGMEEEAGFPYEGGGAEASFEGCRLLLAEDNELNREIAEELIRNMGAELETAENGQEAIDKYMEHEAGYYDMIFMDIQMPVMNGHEACRRIRGSGKEDAKTIPIVAMTANAFAEDVMESQRAGMNEHVSKPLNPAHLAACMGRWLRQAGFLVKPQNI